MFSFCLLYLLWVFFVRFSCPTVVSDVHVVKTFFIISETAKNLNLLARPSTVRCFVLKMFKTFSINRIWLSIFFPLLHFYYMNSKYLILQNTSIIFFTVPIPLMSHLICFVLILKLLTIYWRFSKPLIQSLDFWKKEGSIICTCYI